MRLLNLFRKSPPVCSSQSEETIEALLADGFLDLRLSEKSRDLLARDVTEMDSFTYWVDLPRALKAKTVSKFFGSQVIERVSMYTEAKP